MYGRRGLNRVPLRLLGLSELQAVLVGRQMIRSRARFVPNGDRARLLEQVRFG